MPGQVGLTDLTDCLRAVLRACRCPTAFDHPTGQQLDAHWAGAGIVGGPSPSITITIYCPRIERSSLDQMPAAGRSASGNLIAHILG